MSKSLNNKIKLLTGLFIICIIMCLFNMISNSKAYGSGTSTIYTRDELSEKISPNVFLQSYPVGSIYITTNFGNPGDTYGGTWESYGTGKTLVGLDTTQTEFNTINKVGGIKDILINISNLPSAAIRATLKNETIGKPGVLSSYVTQSNVWFFSAGNWQAGNDNEYTQDSLNNLQPYVVVNMWKRTA